MDLSKEVFVSGTAFVSGAVASIAITNVSWFYAVIISLCIVAQSIYLIRANSFLYDIVVRAFFLGVAFVSGIQIFLSHSEYRLIGLYITCLAVFHFSEFFVTALFNSSSLSIESFILDHSLEYHIAVVMSFTEFFLQCWLLPSYKQPGVASTLGFLCVVTGECLRKAAMVQAGTNFNHQVQSQRAPGHRLVTSGVYAFSRHPSYVGWFMWSVGTQLMLLNPVCFCGFAVASWRFFAERIEREEIFLLKFFGDAYIDYQRRVGTRMPFIPGYILNEDDTSKM